LYPPEIPLALCLCALYARIPAVPKFVLAAIFALAGNYSFVQGNLIWLVTLPVISLCAEHPAGQRPEELRHRVGRLSAWRPVARYFVGLEQNAAAPDYAYGQIGVPPTLSTLQQLRDDPVSTLSRMGRFILGVSGNAISRRFPVADNLAFARSFGAGPSCCFWPSPGSELRGGAASSLNSPCLGPAYCFLLS
jgi:hypothetical protein